MPGDLYTLSLQNKMFRPCLGVYLQTLDADFCGQGAEGFFCPLQMSLHCGIMQEHPRIILHISFFVLFPVEHRLLHLIFAQTNLQNNEILAFLIQFQVQNLEKAGILNKTKISENGKKVR